MGYNLSPPSIITVTTYITKKGGLIFTLPVHDTKHGQRPTCKTNNRINDVSYIPHTHISIIASSMETYNALYISKKLISYVCPTRLTFIFFFQFIAIHLYHIFCWLTTKQLSYTLSIRFNLFINIAFFRVSLRYILLWYVGCYWFQ